MCPFQSVIRIGRQTSGKLAHSDPPAASPCCFSGMEDVGSPEEDERWVYQFKRCRECGFVVRVILRVIPNQALAAELRDGWLARVGRLSVVLLHGGFVRRKFLLNPVAFVAALPGQVLLRVGQLVGVEPQLGLGNVQIVLAGFAGRINRT